MYTPAAGGQLPADTTRRTIGQHDRNCFCCSLISGFSYEVWALIAPGRMTAPVSANGNSLVTC
jgi:hypothetical protein